MAVEEVVRMDKKGRLQIPKRLRKRLDVKPGEQLFLAVEESTLTVRKGKRLDPHTDPLLYDTMINPLHTNKRITSKMLDKLKDEAWMP